MGINKRNHLFKKILSLCLCAVLCLGLYGCARQVKGSISTSLDNISSQYEGFNEAEPILAENVVFTDNELDLEEYENSLGSEEQNVSENTGFENTDISSKNDEPEETKVKQPVTHPDSYYVKWLVPSTFTTFDDDRMAKINQKLEEDGYGFGIKFLYYDEYYGLHSNAPKSDKYHYFEMLTAEDIREITLSSGADIVFTGYDQMENNYIEEDIKNGEYVDLTEYIENGTYFKYLPLIYLDSMKYDGKIYTISSLVAQDGCTLYLLNNGENNVTVDFAPDPMNLFDLISKDNRLFYGLNTLDFVELFGYSYDSIHGSVVDSNGELVNPFEDKRCIEWMRNVNKKCMEGAILFENTNSNKKACNIAFRFGLPSWYQDSQNVIYSQKVGLNKRLVCSTAILSTSQKKDEAFILMELFRSNADYGNLLIYGYTEKDEGKKPVSSFNRKLVLGLDDGLLYGEDDAEIMNHFMSLEERNSFFEENVIASPTLKIDFPVECYEFRKVINKYMHYTDSLMFSENFEEQLKELKKEYTEVYNKVKKLMK